MGNGVLGSAKIEAANPERQRRGINWVALVSRRTRPSSSLSRGNSGDLPRNWIRRDWAWAPLGVVGGPVERKAVFGDMAPSLAGPAFDSVVAIGPCMARHETAHT